jgi:hypothetical protein
MLVALDAYNQKPETSPSSRIPVPRPITLCEDANVLGTPFYIMEFLDGRIFADFRMLNLPPAERKAWYVVLFIKSSVVLTRRSAGCQLFKRSVAFQLWIQTP